MPINSTHNICYKVIIFFTQTRGKLEILLLLLCILFVQRGLVGCFTYAEHTKNRIIETKFLCSQYDEIGVRLLYLRKRK